MHLNKYNVIFLDIQWMYGNALEEMKRNSTLKVVSYIQEQVIAELRNEYSECIQEDDISLPSVLAKINVKTKEQFIIFIDEWDCLFREDKNNENLQKEYINLLRGLFKGTPSGAFLKLAYITGILPIKKYGTQSALNNFREHTMVSPRQMAEYVGFTETEVRSTFLRAIKNDGWEEVIRAISASETLLKASLAMDEQAVAQMIQEVHMKSSSSLIYKNEISLSSVIALAYYSACRDYTLVRELPTGNGFADMVFLPKRTSSNPALVLELKRDKTAEGAISQIKNKGYVSALKEHKGNILLVGINYEKKSRKHQCRIEKVEL